MSQEIAGGAKTNAEKDSRPPWVPKGGECSEHGHYDIGPDCPKCVREVLVWTS